MFEMTDIGTSAAVAVIVGRLVFVSGIKARSAPDPGTPARQGRQTERLHPKDRLELMVKAWANGLTLFVCLLALAATDLSHVPFWLRTLITGACLLALFLATRALTALVFQTFLAKRVD